MERNAARGEIGIHIPLLAFSIPPIESQECGERFSCEELQRKGGKSTWSWAPGPRPRKRLDSESSEQEEGGVRRIAATWMEGGLMSSQGRYRSGMLRCPSGHPLTPTYAPSLYKPSLDFEAAMPQLGTRGTMGGHVETQV